MILAERWHKVALAAFAVSWSSMLLPSLLFPASDGAKVLTLVLLGIGVLAVLALLFHVLLFSRSAN